MLQWLKRHTKKRKYTLVVAPIVVAFIAHASLSTTPTHALIVKADETPFVTVGEEVTVSVRLEAATPINVVGGVVTYPTDLLEVNHISIEDSLMNLWARKPSFSNELGLINFGGGIVEEGGYIGGGNVFTVTFTVLEQGAAHIDLEGAVILAQDGAGTNVLSEGRNGILYARAEGLPSPDVNDDGAITLSDINTVYFGTFGSYDPVLDLNGDGEITFSDVSVLISLY